VMPKPLRNADGEVGPMAMPKGGVRAIVEKGCGPIAWI